MICPICNCHMSFDHCDYCGFSEKPLSVNKRLNNYVATKRRKNHTNNQSL